MRSDRVRGRCPKCERTEAMDADHSGRCRLCGGRLEQKGAGQRGTLKASPGKPRPSLAAFHAAARENGCALAYRGGCGGVFNGHQVWGHHYLPKQRLRGSAEAYADPRNAVGLCVDHHAQVEARRLKCPRPRSSTSSWPITAL